MNKISVIGGSGFVGTKLCHYFLSQKINFEIIDIKKSTQFPEKCIISDVRDISSLRQSITGNVVVNLAAVHRDDVREKLEYYQTNVNGAANIAKVCTEKGINKIVFTSSVAVYGFAPIGTDENGSIDPFNDYGKSKYEAEEKLRKWQIQDKNSLIIVRPTVIFGEGNRGNVYSLFNQVRSRKFIMVGSGKNKKSIAYIDNVVAFLGKCIEADKSFMIYNYVDTPDFDMNSLVDRVRKTMKMNVSTSFRIPYILGLTMGYFADMVTLLTNKKLPLSSIRVKKFCTSSVFTSAKSELDGFEPPFTLQEGIERTLQSEFIDPDPRREVFYTE